MEIPLLSHTFRSTGFINPGAIWSKDKEMSIDMDKAIESLSINMVEAEESEACGTRLPPFLQGQILDNWTIIGLLLSLNFPMSNDHKQPGASA